MDRRVTALAVQACQAVKKPARSGLFYSKQGEAKCFDV